MEKLQPKLRFPEFRDEWIEEILNNIVDVRDGTHDSPKYINDSEYFLLTSKNLNLNGKIDFKDVKYLTKKDFDKINQRSKVEINDILFGMIGTIGNPVIIKELKINFAIKNMALLKKSELILPEFLYQQFRSSLIDKQFNKLNTGNTQKFISLSTIRSLKIFNTSIKEQTKIADFLGAVDKQLDILNQKKEKLNTYKKGVMQQLFSQQLRFKDDNGNNYPDWQEKSLGEVSRITTGISNRQDSDINSEYTFFDRSQEIRKSNRYLFDTEAVIVAGEGSDFIPKYYVGKFDLHQRTYAIMDFEKMIGKYLFYYIYNFRQYFLSQAVGSTVKSLRLPMFEKFKIQIPSIKEQTKIANFLSAIDNQIEAIENQITKTETYKKGLLQQMFV